MKRKIALMVLCIPLAFGTVACSDGQDSSSDEVAETSINTPMPAATEKPTETPALTPTATPTPSSTPTPTATPTPDPVPLVTYDDIMTGNYNEKNIQIDAIIDKIYSPYSGHCSFALWYPSGNTYNYDSTVMNSFYEIEDGCPESVFANAQNGDVIRYDTSVYNDGSFGTSIIKSAEIIGHQDINTIHQTFKQNCPDMNYEDVSRNPDSYKGSAMKISGTIFQIISESNYSAEYLIETSAGYVYASWYDNSDIRGSRFLEDDSVTVYGTFEMLKTYNTLVGDNTVPQLSVVFMDLS